MSNAIQDPKATPVINDPINDLIDGSRSARVAPFP